VAFGPESDFVRHMSIDVATMRLDSSIGRGWKVPELLERVHAPTTSTSTP
jgi:hypothetical protein